MIVFEKLRWKNLLSTGNQFTEFNLSDTRSTLVIGGNGTGKSTMLDALTYGLFNRPFRKVSKGLLVNSINDKDCVVEIEFSVGTVKYKVVRGMKPAIFEIYRNDALLDQDAASRDYQKYLEQSVLKLNYKSFTQVVILGSSTFVPFMQLAAGHRREVIEDLLDIQIFSNMNLLLRERVRDNNESLRDCEYELQVAEERVIAQKRILSALTGANDERIGILEEQFKENEDGMIAVKNNINMLQTKMKELGDFKTQLSALESKWESAKTIGTKLDTKIERIEKDIQFFNEHSTCPTCTQDIDESLRNIKVNSLATKGNELGKAQDQLKLEIAKVRSKMVEFSEAADNYVDMQREIHHLLDKESRLVKTNTRILGEIKNLHDKPNIATEKQTFMQRQAEYEVKEDACAEVSRLSSDYKLVSSLLKDGGIKSKIIAKYIPVINQYINKFLSNMDTYINFTLDEEFNEVIKSRYRDKFSYSSFSEGEKQKIDLSLLFTWRHVAKMKNSIATNLLILDEVFDSSLDNYATEELLKILKGFGDANIFIISHKGDLLLDKFEKTIKFDKVNNFSKCGEVE